VEEKSHKKGLIEALLFLSSEPLKISSLSKSTNIDKTEVRQLLEELVLDFQERDGGFLLREVALGFQFVSNPNYSEILSVIFKDKKRETLSRGTLDTLAIIAYKQPITLVELDEIRGVSSRGMVASLISKKLIKPVGQKEVPGRPTLYGTTNEFLVHFGLSKLSDLPTPVEVKEMQFEELPEHWEINEEEPLPFSPESLEKRDLFPHDPLMDDMWEPTPRENK